MAAAKKRAVSRGAWIFALLTLLIAAFAAVLATGKSCHLTLHVDGSEMSEVLREALYEAASVESLLTALETDDDISPAELHGRTSLLNERLATMEELAEQIDLRLGVGTTAEVRYADSLHSINRGVEWLGIGLAVVSFAVLGLLILALVLLCLKYPCAAALLSAFAALLAGLATLLPVSLAGWLMDLLSENLAVARLYGVSCAARLTLTDSGKAQVLLSAAALFLCACACLLATRRRRKK